MPAIDLLKTHFQITDLDSGTGPSLHTFLFQTLTSISQTIDVYPVHSRTYTTTPLHERTKQKSTRYSIRLPPPLPRSTLIPIPSLPTALYPPLVAPSTFLSPPLASPGSRLPNSATDHSARLITWRSLIRLGPCLLLT